MRRIDADELLTAFPVDDEPFLTKSCVRMTIQHIIHELPSAQPEQRWIPCSERLPDNADKPGAFCPRYLVMTKWGVTEGWYRPYEHAEGGRWYVLIWFMDERCEQWNISMERGDVCRVVENVKVVAWMPLPEPYEDCEE